MWHGISYPSGVSHFLFFFFQAEDGIRDWSVTGVQTCALPILEAPAQSQAPFPLVVLAAETAGAGDRADAVQRPDRSVGVVSHVRHIRIRIRKVRRSEERRVGKECRSRWAPER